MDVLSVLVLKGHYVLGQASDESCEKEEKGGVAVGIAFEGIRQGLGRTGWS